MLFSINRDYHDILEYFTSSRKNKTRYIKKETQKWTLWNMWKQYLYTISMWYQHTIYTLSYVCVKLFQHRLHMKFIPPCVDFPAQTFPIMISMVGLTFTVNSMVPFLKVESMSSIVVQFMKTGNCYVISVRHMVTEMFQLTSSHICTFFVDHN